MSPRFGVNLVESAETKQPTKGKQLWLGGYVRHNKGGATYIIEKMIHGRRYHLSTHCKTERAALKALERFEADPEGFADDPTASPGVVATADLVLGYRAHMLAKGNTKDWVGDVCRYLVDWLEDLGTKDLRRVKLHDLKTALDKHKTSRKHRIEAIKGFYGWLRKDRGLLRHAEDPTLDLPVPQGSAAKLRRRRAIEPERIRAAFAFMSQPLRDVVLMLTATGWHVNEVVRWAEKGELSEFAGRDDGVLAIAVTWHKTKRRAMTALKYPEHVAAAKRLKAKPPANRHTLFDHTKKACIKAGVAPFGLGDMRHSFATYAAAAGADPAVIARVLDHRSKRTTEDMYIDLAVPTAQVPVLRLVHG